MYGGSSDGEGHESLSKKIPQASSMPWARNLRRYIGSGAGLGSEALMELETKRILLELFKERQQKSSNTGTIPSFYRKKPSEGSIGSRVQRLAKFRFLRKQSDLLLNADDLDTMWVCLRENCVIDDSTGAEKMNYDDFCHIASVCTEQIGPKCRRFFCPSNFMKFEKDESGRIAILPFYLYVMRTVSLTQARIDMSELDEDADGFLQPHEMEAYIRGLIPNLAQLRDMPPAFLQMYCRIAAHKFFFFCDPYRRVYFEIRGHYHCFFRTLQGPDVYRPLPKKVASLWVAPVECSRQRTKNVVHRTLSPAVTTMTGKEHSTSVEDLGRTTKHCADS